MALNNSFSFFHFLLRFIGLTGLFGGLVGLALWQGIGIEQGRLVALIGAGMLALGLLGELRGAFGMTFSRRGAVGVSVTLQIVLALALLAGLNYFSFFHYQRIDCTRDADFTLPDKIKSDLAQLREDTTIVVFQRHTAFGYTADNRQDNYDAAAERKIVEKVKDLAELFQDFGPRFRVQLLDIQDDKFEDNLKVLKKENPALAEAIEKTPDNSIFFYAQDADTKKERVQRLSFQDIYQLDKKKSQEAHKGNGNLVLHDQGIDNFANKVLNIEEKKPRIGFGVIHEFMGVDGAETIGMAGVKRALEARGYECRDIVLKQSMEDPAVLTHDEHKHERLEIQLQIYERNLKLIAEKQEKYQEETKDFDKLSMAELNKKYLVAQDLDGRLHAIARAGPRPSGAFLGVYPKIDQEVREDYMEDLRRTLEDLGKSLKRIQDQQQKALDTKQSLVLDNLDEVRRITDLRAKFNRVLADLDLLVLPRQTIHDVALDWVWPYEWYKLDTAHIDAIKDYMKAGNPVLFCMGPPLSGRRLGARPVSDDIDQLLSSLGIEMPAQAILFNSESETLENFQQKVKLARAPDVPPLEVEPYAARASKFALDLHPIRASLRLSGRSFSKSYPSDLKVRAPRPIYAMTVARESAAAALALADSPAGMGPLLAASFAAAKLRKVNESAVILLTSAESWNDDQPFPTEERVPRLEHGKDPNRGTILEKREGPFPIGVAVETKLPESWFDGKAKPTTTRFVVLGHGGMFMGENLTPMKEKLLLDTANWLMGRDDLLARDRATWSFPRVELDKRAETIWTWGAWFGVPLVFVYLGTLMWLIRRMR
ncbi:MAG: hypothetical protein L0215_01860 [Gemmataceae bacterium]|nr:hypothetical protein [Gemmataceae bacterium]